MNFEAPAAAAYIAPIAQCSPAPSTAERPSRSYADSAGPSASPYRRQPSSSASRNPSRERAPSRERHPAPARADSGRDNAPARSANGSASGSARNSYGSASDTGDSSSFVTARSPSQSSRRTASRSPKRSSRTPSWARAVLSRVGDSGLERAASSSNSTLDALEHIRAGDVPPETLVDDIPSILRLIGDDPSNSDPEETFAVIAALHVLASDSLCRDAMLPVALEKITSLVDASSSPGPPVTPPSRNRSSESTPSPAPLVTSLPLPVWEGAIRMMSKLVVFSPSACSDSIHTPLLSLLAAAALPTEPFETRVRAAAGIASVSAWSGPLFAVEILETPNVIAAMAGILTDRDDRIPSSLRTATLDGLTVMAHRRRARVILIKNGCGDFISMAARLASVSGDYDIAARSTVVAGQVAGRSVDEFGFLVEKPADDTASDPKTDGDDDRSLGKERGNLSRAKTGLALIQKNLMQEPGFVKNIDSKGLEYVVDQGADTRASVASSGDLGCFQNEVNGMMGVDVQRSPKSPYPGASADCMAVNNPMDDPDDDRPVDMATLSDFTSATERAAARNSKPGASDEKTPWQKQADAKNEQIWENVLANRLDVLQRHDGVGGRVLAYRELALVPIPTKLRSVLWPMLLQVEDLRTRKPGLYQSLCCHGKENQLPEDLEHTIEADLTRTMPSHCIFWRSGAAPGIDALRRVLRAYAFHVPSVGYCQGMSSIAALLLLNSEAEEDAFLMLVRFLSWYGYKNVFKPGFPQYKEWVEEFRGVLEARYPQLHAKMESEGVIPELFLDKGIITCLTHNYPHRVLVRVWDVMLLGGSPKIVLKVCLAVLVMGEKRLMAMRFEDMVNFLQRDFADPVSGVVKDETVEEFLDVARGLKLTTEPLHAVSGSSGQTTMDTNVGTAEGPGKKKNGLSACFPCFSREKQD